MRYMLVTLDVSKLSGWLNADAPCRVKRRAYYVWGEMRVGRLKGATAAQAVCTGEVLRLKIGGGGTTRNIVSMVLTLAVLRVSGWLNVDANCRVGWGAYQARRGASREMGEGVGQRRKRYAGEGPTS